jgi:hypothetical protein
MQWINSTKLPMLRAAVVVFALSAVHDPTRWCSLYSCLSTCAKKIVFSAHNQVFCQLLLSSALIGHPLSELLRRLNIIVVHPAFILFW